MSPLWNQPSVNASAVAVSLFQYRRNTIGPDSSTSPSSAIRTPCPGTGRPDAADALRVEACSR